jgi:hypothetical protein
MMAFRKVKSLPGVAVASAGLIISLAGCGSDSTGPGNLDSAAALRSLSLGMAAISTVQSPEIAPLDAAFGAITPVLDQIDVTIDGKSQRVFALGLRESFPEGTCEENVFIDPLFPPQPGVCTPLSLGLALILWQSHSASAPPDRLIFIAGDVGTSDFDFLASLNSPTLPAVAVYMEGQDNVWLSLSGTLTSTVTATNQSCGLPLPPYAKAGSCSIATFDEQGTITFEPADNTSPSTKRLNLTIPRETIHGLWEQITETQPITLSGLLRTSRWLSR